MCFRVPLLFLAAMLPAMADIWLQPVRDGSNQVEMSELGEGVWEVRTTGSDPYFFLRTGGEEIDLGVSPMFEMDYTSPTGIGPSLLFVGPILDIPHLLQFKLDGARDWSSFALDLSSTAAPATNVRSLRLRVGDRAGLVARFRRFRARALTPAEGVARAERESRERAGGEQARRLDEYLGTDFPHRIERVELDGPRLTIRGVLAQGANASKLWLVEIPMWEDVTNLRQPVRRHRMAPDAHGGFTLGLKLDEESEGEPLLSAWAVAERVGERWVPRSHARYVDAQRLVDSAPSAGPGRLKGMGGIPFDHPDMEELGIRSVTLNIVLNDFFRPEPGAGIELRGHDGQSWKMNESVVAEYDRHLRLAAGHDCLVSAIVLLRPPGPSPGDWERLACHPDAEPPGVYVLPNFTTREGTLAYISLMKFLTDRYSRGDAAHGRVHHWIMHNEVNSGFYWANAGRKSALAYMALYQKSMRVVQTLARRRDAHAKALISLDHNWNVNPDPRGYTARELLRHLLALGRAEGDFEWGLAFHPYAQDLRNPRVWEDSEALLDLNTPYLTYQNLEVLDRWVEQPDVRFDGRPREIQCTEQGINTPDYTPETFQTQAASLAYVWKKLHTLRNVTAFQYHQWADHPDEEGLRLGMRKFGVDPEDPYGIKPIWHLYKALGTAEEEAVLEPFKKVLGSRTWSDVSHRGPIPGLE